MLQETKQTDSSDPDGDTVVDEAIKLLLKLRRNVPRKDKRVIDVQVQRLRRLLEIKDTERRKVLGHKLVFQVIERAYELYQSFRGRRRITTAVGFRSYEEGDDLNMNIGRSIRDVRLRVGMSQRDLAAKSGLTVNYLSLVENGHRKNISLEKLAVLARVLNIPVSFFSILSESPDSEIIRDLQELTRTALVRRSSPGIERRR